MGEIVQVGGSGRSIAMFLGLCCEIEWLFRYYSDIRGLAWSKAANEKSM